MRLLKNRSIGFYLAFILILAMAIGGSAVAAFADSGTATATLNAGTLSPATGDFTGAVATVTLNGHNQTPSYSLPVTVTDSRGSGAGWHLQISGADLTRLVNDPKTEPLLP